MSNDEIPYEDVENLKRLFESIHGSFVSSSFEDGEFSEIDNENAATMQVVIEAIEDLLDSDSENQGISPNDAHELDEKMIEYSRRWRDMS